MLSASVVDDFYVSSGVVRVGDVVYGRQSKNFRKRGVIDSIDGDPIIDNDAVFTIKWDEGLDDTLVRRKGFWTETQIQTSLGNDYEQITAPSVPPVSQPQMCTLGPNSHPNPYLNNINPQPALVSHGVTYLLHPYGQQLGEGQHDPRYLSNVNSNDYNHSKSRRLDYGEQFDSRMPYDSIAAQQQREEDDEEIVGVLLNDDQSESGGDVAGGSEAYIRGRAFSIPQRPEIVLPDTVRMPSRTSLAPAAPCPYHVLMPISKLPAELRYVRPTKKTEENRKSVPQPRFTCKVCRSFKASHYCTRCSKLDREDRCIIAMCEPGTGRDCWVVHLKRLNIPEGQN